MTKQYYTIKIRRYRMKQEAIKLKGGKCSICGWSGNIAALQFHHRDPSIKEFTLSSTHVGWEKYWEEVEKCDLVCANCHAIIHAKNNDVDFLTDVERYGGRELVTTDIPWKNQTHIPAIYTHNCCFCKKDFQTKRRIQKYCSSECQKMNLRKVIRPEKDELQQLVKEYTMIAISKKYGVSDNAVRKWCKSYNINYK